MRIKLILEFTGPRVTGRAEKMIEIPDPVPPTPFTIRTAFGERRIEGNLSALVWDEPAREFVLQLARQALDVRDQHSYPQTADERLFYGLIRPNPELGWTIVLDE